MADKAALYIRVSTREQAEGGYSVEAQRQFLEEWARREGYGIYEAYIDDGYSGKNMDRPALQRMLRDATKKLFKVILVYHNDRLSRNTQDALKIVKDLAKHGVRIRFSNLDMDLTTPEGELIFTSMASFATYFRKDLARKVLLGMMRKARTPAPEILKEAKGLGGHAPYGYTYDKTTGEYSIVDEEAEVVRLIYALYIEAHGGMRAIADYLNEQGIPSPTGEAWHISTISRILKNPFYCGFFKWNGILKRGTHEPIITLEMFNEAQRVIAQRRVTGRYNPERHEIKEVVDAQELPQVA